MPHNLLVTMKKSFIFLGLISSLSVTSADDRWLTIFVHGIINIQPHITVSNLFKFYYDTIENTAYARAVELVRKDPFFWECQTMDALGLKKIDTSLHQPGKIPPLFARLYHEISKINAPKPGIDTYYTFGWSGLFSNSVRYLEAEIFYNQLSAEIEKYKKSGIEPKVRIVGYSHGGNVAINLATIHEHKQADFMIDELILIGVPITTANKKHISSPLFKKIYHFYSPADRVQALDCLTSQSFFSARTFEESPDFKLPKNLVQIAFRLKRIAFCHDNGKPNKFHFNRLRNADPGHTEWWSFGWAYNYRQYLPICPLPAASFLTFITQAIDHNLPDARRITVDIRPYEDTMILSTKKKVTMVPFIPSGTLAQLKNLACTYKPAVCSAEEYTKRYSAAQLQAEKELAASHEKICRSSRGLKRRKVCPRKR